jgi:hypothetical protein
MSWQQSDLVNIKPKLNWGLEAPTDRVLKLANAKRPKEVKEFVEALSRMFGRIGMHGVCGLCFKGRLNAPALYHHSVGCCGGCPLLTATKCANKPMYCAQWMCDTVGTLFPKTRDMLGRIRGEIFRARIATGAWTSGLDFELKHEPTKVQRRLLRQLTAVVEAWNEVQP